MISEGLIQLGIGGFGAVVGYFLKDYLDRRKEAEIRRIEDVRNHYINLMLCMKALSEGRRDKDELLRFEYCFLWLNASDSVIKSFNHLLRRLSSEGDKPTVALEVGELILAMRRDLGFGRTRLSASEYKSDTIS